MKEHCTHINFSSWQVFGLVALRVTIGWHFLYEGMVKVVNPNWTAAAFLQASQGPLEMLFKNIAGNANILVMINFLNQWGLVFVGLSLMVGLLNRWACLAGMALLFLYYLSNPPLIGLEPPVAAEGSYLIVNKNLVELFALLVLFLFPTDKIIGLGRMVKWKWEFKKNRI